MQRSPFAYAPGSVTAVFGGPFAALLSLAPDHELVGGVLDAVQSEDASLDRVLEVLISLGLRVVDSFALAEVTDAGVRVVVRGSGRVQVQGSEDIPGSGLWVDRFLPGHPTIRLLAAEAPGAARLPMGTGVALASVVEHLGTPLASAPVSASASARGSTPAPAPGASPTPPVAGPSAAASDPDAAPIAAASGPAASVTASVPDPDDVPDFDHLFGATVRPIQPPPSPASSPSPAGPVAAAPSAANAAAPGSPATAHRTMPSPFTTPVPGAPLAGAGLVEPPAPVKPGGTFIEAMPWNDDGSPLTPPPGAALPTPPASGFPAAEPSPPRPEMTIDREQLKGHGGAVGPIVVAARCPHGHLSPAYAGVCRVCRQPLPAQQPFEVPRPPLGVLRLQNGDTVLLDRGAVLGRSPRLPSGWTDEQPNLVKIHDPERDISSQHVEVRLDFWHVLVRDLGSTNGTEVILPGTEPVALRPHDPMAIEPGTRIVLAGVFDITFEVVA